jgi:hypothetical protein
VKILNKISQFIIPRYLILLAVICLLPVVIYYIYLNNEADSSGIDNDDLITSVPSLMEQIGERWGLADVEGLYGTDKFQCTTLPNDIELYDPQFLKCNPEYLRCMFNGELVGVTPYFELGKLKLIPVKKDSGYIDIQEQGKIKIEFIEETLQRKVHVQLSNYCNSTYLPKNIYSSGPQSEQDYVWDNYNYDIFVDKFYVTNYDVLRWSNKKNINKDKLYYPSLDLTLLEREKYCIDQGKVLLSSRVFDAAVFYPNKRIENFSFKYPYPWTKKRKTFLTNDMKLSKFDCRKTYVSECNKIYKLKKNSSNSISWIGLTSSLGGEMESFSNIYNPRANLKVSSSKLSRASNWHKNGVRAHWNGVDFENRDFEFIEQYSNKQDREKISELGVAFRCMKLK